MKVYKTYFNDSCCIHDNLNLAKETLIIDIQYDEELDLKDEDLIYYAMEIRDLTERDLKKPYKIGKHMLQTGEMSEEELRSLPEFEGY